MAFPPRDAAGRSQWDPVGQLLKHQLNFWERQLCASGRGADSRGYSRKEPGKVSYK